MEWNLPCKHFFCIFEFYPQWNWYCLPEQYTKSAYLSTDQDALNSFFSAHVEHLDAADHYSDGDNGNDTDEIPSPVDDVEGEIPAKKVCSTCNTLFINH